MATEPDTDGRTVDSHAPALGQVADGPRDPDRGLLDNPRPGPGASRGLLSNPRSTGADGSGGGVGGGVGGGRGGGRGAGGDVAGQAVAAGAGGTTDRPLGDETPVPKAPRRRRQLSLRVRLLAGLIALAAVGVVAADVFALSTLRRTQLSKVDVQLAGAQGMRGGGGPPGGFGGGNRGGGPTNFYTAFFQADGTPIEGGNRPVGSTSTPTLPTTMSVSSVVAFGQGPVTVDSVNGDERWRIKVFPNERIPVTLTDQSTGLQTVGFVSGTEAVAINLADIDATYRQVLYVDLGVLAAVVAGMVVLGVVVVRVGLRPLESMAATADRIAAGDLSQRVETTDRRTEVGRLGDALNGMLTQIEASFTRQQATEDRLRRFVGDASHELRTPLTSIRGFAELIRSGMTGGPEGTARAVGRIEAEATRMGGLVEDLLLLARLDEQRPLDRLPVDLGRLVRDAAADARAVDPSRPVTVTVDGEPTVLGDDARLRQVLANLVANALRHTPTGTPLHLGVGVLDGEAVLAVADTGPGMEPADAARIFERFYRVDPSRTRGTTGGGSGLGLAIVQSVVEAHSGRVGLVTAPGRGATFTVTIPAVDHSE